MVREPVNALTTAAGLERCGSMGTFSCAKHDEVSGYESDAERIGGSVQVRGPALMPESHWPTPGQPCSRRFRASCTEFYFRAELSISVPFPVRYSKHLTINRFLTASIRPNLTSVAQHLSGSADSWHGKITPDGPFTPESNRYHLYIGLFCPFAHRVNIVRHLKGLQEFLPLSIVKPYPKGDETGWPGWQFPKDDKEYPGATVDHLFGSEYLHKIYFKADPEYRGRYSVPNLWDKSTNTIVNNESADLLRDLQTAFNPLLSPELAAVTLYPPHLRAQIDAIATWLQRDLNTGVYKAGFAPDQATYDKNVIPVFAALNAAEKLLASSRGPYLLGTTLTEVDIRLYATAIRFDAVYVQHFKCNLGTIRHDYPRINNWLKNLYWNVPGFRETTDFTHIKENYTKSHTDINPKAITPMGPWPDIEQGFEPDFTKLRVGEVTMPAVLAYERDELQRDA